MMAFARFTFNDGFFAEIIYQFFKTYYLSTFKNNEKEKLKKIC